jgi:hypothetical protein
MPTTTDDITKLVSTWSSKSCNMDQIHTHLLKANLSSLAPVIADMLTCRLRQGFSFPPLKNLS